LFRVGAKNVEVALAFVEPFANNIVITHSTSTAIDRDRRIGLLLN
jgi:hypothetical protein